MNYFTVLLSPLFNEFPIALTLNIAFFKLLDALLNDLDLSNYVRGYNASSYKYDLYGVCNHMGGVMGGHYTAFVKHAENKWIHFNDSSVELVDDPNKIITPLAYCLFYRKKNN